MPFVLDCSVTMSWVFADEANATTEALRESLIEDMAVVPALWSIEVANAARLRGSGDARAGVAVGVAAGASVSVVGLRRGLSRAGATSGATLGDARQGPLGSVSKGGRQSSAGVSRIT